MKRALIINILAVAAGLCAAEVVSRILQAEPQGVSLAGRDLKCAIEIGRYSDSTRALTAGYNYTVLKRFAEEMGSTAEISLSLDGEDYLDSLTAGTVDIVVRPLNDTCAREDLLRSDTVGDLATWVVDGTNEIALEEIDGWLASHHSSEAYVAEHDLYVKAVTNPFLAVEKGWKRRSLSPYDSLFVAYAPQLGWNWKKLAALVYQESRFHIEALSRRGATGLMQMMPHTASRYDRDNLLDPEENLRAGVAYLQRLQKMFSTRVAADQLDIFTLAAYNAGEGRIIDCINYAQYRNVYDSTWASICAVLPEMNEDAILEVDTVKVGKFSGGETLAFLDNIMALEEAFDEILSK